MYGTYLAVGIATIHMYGTYLAVGITTIHMHGTYLVVGITTIHMYGAYLAVGITIIHMYGAYLAVGITTIQVYYPLVTSSKRPQGVCIEKYSFAAHSSRYDQRSLELTPLLVTSSDSDGGRIIYFDRLSTGREVFICCPQFSIRSEITRTDPISCFADTSVYPLSRNSSAE